MLEPHIGKVGFIIFGNLGNQITRNLARAVHELKIYDANEETLP